MVKLTQNEARKSNALPRLEIILHAKLESYEWICMDHPDSEAVQRVSKLRPCS